MDLLPSKFPLACVYSNHVYMGGNQYRIICISCKYSSTFNLGRGRVGVPALLVVYLFSIISPYCHDYGVKKARKRRRRIGEQTVMMLLLVFLLSKLQPSRRALSGQCCPIALIPHSNSGIPQRLIALPTVK